MFNDAAQFNLPDIANPAIAVVGNPGSFGGTTHVQQVNHKAILPQRKQQDAMIKAADKPIYDVFARDRFTLLVNA